MTTITNYNAGLAVTGDWAWHIAHGYTGGTDYKTTTGTAVRAPVTGVVSHTGNGLTPGIGLSITYQPGYAISVRELARVTVAAGAKVTRGQVIGYTSSKYSHIDITIHGVRHDWTPYITPSITVQAINTIKNLGTTLPKENTMFIATTSKSGAHGGNSYVFTDFTAEVPSGGITAARLSILKACKVPQVNVTDNGLTTLIQQVKANAALLPK